MATPHIESRKEDIATIVLMPGDPMRAKYIAEHFLEDYYLVNDVRGILGYTGFYKGKRVTVFASGMGIPSIGIYAYELYKFYDVETIIRIGSCGSNHPDVKLLDVVLADSAYSTSDFAQLFHNEIIHEVDATVELNHHIEEVATTKNISFKKGPIITSDVFDVYVDGEQFKTNFLNYDNYLATEMEAFCLFYLAKLLNRSATCLLTVVDSKFDKRVITSEDRETSLNDMISLALESII